jgi:hypothetical protein
VDYPKNAEVAEVFEVSWSYEKKRVHIRRRGPGNDLSNLSILSTLETTMGGLPATDPRLLTDEQATRLGVDSESLWYHRGDSRES